MRYVLSLAVLAAAPAAFADPPKPNVVVILTDDMGFSDLGCYGGEIATPNLDALAAGGLRFTQFYNTARCCPTRASLLTGLYPHQAGVGHMMEDRGETFPSYRGNLNTSCRTIPEVLKPAGYRNYAVGKWHVTRHAGKDGPKHNWPLARGFDRYYGTIHGAGSFYDPSSLVRDDAMISPFADPDYKPATYYYTDAIADHAARFVGDHAKDHAGKPFFLYVAFTAAHWPPARGRRQVRGQVRPWIRPRPQGPFRQGGEARADRPGPADEPAGRGVGQGRRQGVGGRGHGDLRRDGGPHGPGRRQDRRRVEADRAV
jgi:arylsulfatase